MTYEEMMKDRKEREEIKRLHEDLDKYEKGSKELLAIAEEIDRRLKRLGH